MSGGQGDRPTRKGDSKMKRVNVNGREVITNYGGYYPYSDGDNKKTMRMVLKEKFNETDREMLERLAGAGYTRITFYETTTRVRGLHEIIAFVK